MGNDIKVAPSIFLQENPADLAKTIPYILEDEFAKTKKNKNYILYLLVGLFLVIVIVGTIFLTNYITNQSMKVEIKISDFEELNLKDVLAASKKDYNGLIQAKQELSDLQNNLKNDLTLAKSDIQKQIDLTKQKGLSTDDEAKAEKVIQDDGQKKIQSIQDNYAYNIRKKQDEIKVIEKSIGQYDQKMIDTANKSSQILGDSQKLHDLELNRQQKYYEDKIQEMDKRQQNEIKDLKNYYMQYINVLVLKYNPIFAERDIYNIISDVSSISNGGLSLRLYVPLLNDEKVFSSSQFGMLRQKISDSDKVLTRLQKIPFTNSVPSALTYLDYVNVSIIQDYENMWWKLTEVVSNKNSSLSSYMFAIESYSKNQRENGFVLDPRDTKKVTVYLDKVYLVQPGDQALVFRGNNEFICTLQFYQDGDSMKAKVLELDKSVELQPFDKILLKLNQGE